MIEDAWLYLQYTAHLVRLRLATLIQARSQGCISNFAWRGARIRVRVIVSKLSGEGWGELNAPSSQKCDPGSNPVSQEILSLVNCVAATQSPRKKCRSN